MALVQIQGARNPGSHLLIIIWLHSPHFAHFPHFSHFSHFPHFPHFPHFAHFAHSFRSSHPSFWCRLFILIPLLRLSFSLFTISNFCIFVISKCYFISFMPSSPSAPP